MNGKTTTSRIFSLLLGLLRRRREVSTDHFVELLFVDRAVAASSDLLSPLRSRFVSEDDLGSIRELGDVGTTELLDCLLEGRTVHGAESATGCDHLTSKRVRLAVRHGLLLAVGLGGAFAVGLLVGLGSLGLGFGICFAFGGCVGSVVTGGESVHVLVMTVKRNTYAPL
jgi:hypothetical protein